MGRSPRMRRQRTTHMGTAYDSAIVSQPEPGDWGTQEITNRHTEEVLRIVDGMGGHDPMYEQVLNFELDDPDNQGFVIGVGEQTPPVTYDKKKRQVVKERNAIEAWSRERAKREATTQAATGLQGPFPTIYEI